MTRPTITAIIIPQTGNTKHNKSSGTDNIASTMMIVEEEPELDISNGLLVVRMLTPENDAVLIRIR